MRSRPVPASSTSSVAGSANQAYRWACEKGSAGFVLVEPFAFCWRSAGVTLCTMSIASQLGTEIGQRGDLFAEEMRLLERSGTTGIDINSAMDIMAAALSAAYPKVSAGEISGLVTHHIGAAMREARALNKK